MPIWIVWFLFGPRENIPLGLIRKNCISITDNKKIMIMMEIILQMMTMIIMIMMILIATWASSNTKL